MAMIRVRLEEKRLLIKESEFAPALRVSDRHGNTLSAVVRDAWDTGDLGNLTKNDPAKTHGAHVSIIGHITKTELIRYLDKTETASAATQNRPCVATSKPAIEN
jgi:hypothetical protein